MKKSIKILIVAAGIGGGSFTSTAMADKCGKDDRAALPSCTKLYRVGPAGYGSKVKITNNCSGDVTVKIDIDSFSDKRLTVPAGESVTVETPHDRFAVLCCPRYNNCSF